MMAEGDGEVKKEAVEAGAGGARVRGAADQRQAIEERARAEDRHERLPMDPTAARLRAAARIVPAPRSGLRWLRFRGHFGVR